MNVLTAPYNPPPTGLLGMITGFAIIAIAGVILWKSGSIGSQQKLRMVLAATLFGATGVTMLATTAHLALIQINPSGGLHVSLGVVSMHFAAVLVLVGTVIAAIIKRSVIGFTGSALLLVASFTTFADLNVYWSNSDSWALGVTLGWAATAGTAASFVTTVVVLKIQAYGRKQFQRGQLAGLDKATPAADRVGTS